MDNVLHYWDFPEGSDTYIWLREIAMNRTRYDEEQRILREYLQTFKDPPDDFVPQCTNTWAEDNAQYMKELRATRPDWIQEEIRVDIVKPILEFLLEQVQSKIPESKPELFQDKIQPAIVEPILEFPLEQVQAKILEPKPKLPSEKIKAKNVEHKPELFHDKIQADEVEHSPALLEELTKAEINDPRARCLVIFDDNDDDDDCSFAIRLCMTF